MSASAPRMRASAPRMSVSAPRMSASRPGSSASAGGMGARPPHPPARPPHPPADPRGRRGAAGLRHLAVAVRHHPAGTRGSAASSPCWCSSSPRPSSGSWSSCSNRFTARRTASVTVTIPAHSTASQIGDELANAGVVSSGFFFELRATLDGKRGQLLTGTYHLQQGMTYSAVLKVLSTPPAAAKVTNITIIEGRTRAQINDLLRAQGVAGSYFVATRRSPLINFAAYGAPRHTPDLEGFLFPDTYQLVEPIGIPKLVTDQLTTFRQQFAGVNLGYARSKHLTPYDVLIIASLVQAEAATAHDQPLVASVVYNRLALGMPLQLDSTTRYATGNYTEPLTQAQLNSPSPYNTRNHKGLPPTPIDNPGLAAIEAAAHPARTSYLYFVARAVRQRLKSCSRRTTTSSWPTRRSTSRRAALATASRSPAARSDAPWGRRLAGGAQPLAGHAERRARGRRAARLALPVASDSTGAVRRDGGGAPGCRLSRCQRHDPAQASRARPRHGPDGASARDRGRQHPPVRARRSDSRRQHRRAGPDRRASGLADRPDRARAGGRRERSGRGMGAA